MTARTQAPRRLPSVSSPPAVSRSPTGSCVRQPDEITKYLRERFDGVIRRITDLDDRDYQRLVTTVTWLRANPASGMLLRQLPIEGIDTKWLSSHAQLILALLGDSDHGAPSPIPARPCQPQGPGGYTNGSDCAFHPT